MRYKKYFKTKPINTTKKPKSNEDILENIFGKSIEELYENTMYPIDEIKLSMKEAVSQERSRILGLIQEEINQWSFIDESSKEAIGSIKTKIEQG